MGRDVPYVEVKVLVVLHLQVKVIRWFCVM